MSSKNKHGIGFQLCFSIVFALIHLQTIAQPKDNPYKTFYPHVQVHWSDSIRWNMVWNINDFQDTSMVARYTKARDFVAAQGGGVLFFPAGTYTFENSIQFKAGVVIRGETPAVVNAKDSLFAPPTRFVFPKYIPSDTGSGTPNSTAFKSITALANTSNSGLVFVDIDRASVSLRSQTFLSVQTPRGTTNQSQETNRNLILFGIRSNNVASPYNTVPSARQFKWQRFSSPFASNLSIFAWKNACIANCRINDFERNGIHPIPNLSFEQPGYIADRNTNPNPPMDTLLGYQAIFSYTDHHGISMNRKATITNATPEEEPDNFRSGLEIRDNWIYKTMRVGIICSGLGIIIDNNQILDRPNKQTWLHPIGSRIATNNAATYENRGIDFGGWNVQITRNDMYVYRHKIYNGPYYSVDGEGILSQECCGGTTVNGARISKNKTHNTYIGLWKVRSINNIVIDSNEIGNESVILTANTFSGNGKFWFYPVYDCTIKSNICTSIEVDGNRGGRNLKIFNNSGSGNGGIRAPCFAQIANNSGFNSIQYTTVKDTVFGSVIQTNPCIQDSLTFTKVEMISPSGPDTLVAENSNIKLRIRWNGGKVDSVYFYENVRKIGAFASNQKEMTFNSGSCGANVPKYFWAAVKDTVRKLESRTEMKKVSVACITKTTGKVENQKDWSIYPNPGNGKFFVKNLPDGERLRLYSTTGKLLHSKIIQNQILDFGNLEKGMYFLKREVAQSIEVLKIMVY